MPAHRAELNIPLRCVIKTMYVYAERMFILEYYTVAPAANQSVPAEVTMY